MSPQNEYTGFHPPSKSWTPDRIDPSSISPQTFFSKYIATRTPCILSSHPSDSSWLASTKWTIPYLKQAAGNQLVKIERKDEQGGFGSGGRREKMAFKNFLDALQGGEVGLYMTTQYRDEEDETDDDEMERVLEFLPPPVTALVGDFPLDVGILGGLVTQMVNLWIGSTPRTEPTSSGLHHDYHDNLYILLRGQKRFTLFSPQDTLNLDTHGEIKTVFSNGYIQYEGAEQDGRRADGARIVSVAKWKVAMAEKAFEEAEAKGEGVEEAEEALEEALMGLMGHGDDEMDDLGDDDDEEEDEDEDEDADSERENLHGSTAKRKTSAASDTLPPTKRPKQDITSSSPIISTEPPSFSRIPTSILHTSTPLSPHPFLQKATPVTVTIEEGEMLYLPAGWFHEVTSFGSASGNIHMAFNYWCAPPTRDDFESPYEDKYWESLKEDVERLVHKLRK